MQSAFFIGILYSLQSEWFLKRERLCIHDRKAINSFLRYIRYIEIWISENISFSTEFSRSSRKKDKCTLRIREIEFFEYVFYFCTYVLLRVSKNICLTLWSNLVDLLFLLERFTAHYLLLAILFCTKEKYLISVYS